MKKLFVFFVLLVIVALAGCVSKSKARLQQREAFVAGQQQAIAQMQQGPTVTFVGDVQNRTVPWTEDLTLSSAIVSAEFRGRRDPKMFVLRRGGESYSVSSQQLLRGEDFALQAGDTIEIVP